MPALAESRRDCSALSVGKSATSSELVGEEKEMFDERSFLKGEEYTSTSSVGPWCGGEQFLLVFRGMMV